MSVFRFEVEVEPGIMSQMEPEIALRDRHALLLGALDGPAVMRAVRVVRCAVIAARMVGRC